MWKTTRSTSIIQSLVSIIHWDFKHIQHGLIFCTTILHQRVMLTLEPDEALPTSKFMHGWTDIRTGMSFINAICMFLCIKQQTSCKVYHTGGPVPPGEALNFNLNFFSSEFSFRAWSKMQRNNNRTRSGMSRLVHVLRTMRSMCNHEMFWMLQGNQNGRQCQAQFGCPPDKSTCKDSGWGKIRLLHILMMFWNSGAEKKHFSSSIIATFLF